jgi:hypothetical protein
MFHFIVYHSLNRAFAVLVTQLSLPSAISNALLNEAQVGEAD